MARVSTRASRPISAGIAGRVNPIEFLQETISELRKSVWPSREEVSRLTMIVMVMAVIASFFLGGLDQIFQLTSPFILLN